jgi:signal peptidase II
MTLRRSTRIALVLGIAAFVVLADSVSKAWAIGSLRAEDLVLVPDALELTYAENPGVAFSMFAEAPSLIRLGVLPALALAAALLFFFRASSHRGSDVARVGGALVVGGALGNALDRIRLGHVVDFIHAHAGACFDYPVFNVADVAVFVGIALLVLDASRRTVNGTPDRAD